MQEDSGPKPGQERSGRIRMRRVPDGDGPRGVSPSDQHKPPAAEGAKELSLALL